MSEENECEDEDCQHIPRVPDWPWSWFEVPAIACRVVAASARSLGQGLDMLALEFQAAAENQRHRRADEIEEAAHQAALNEMAADLRETVYGPEELL